jgi:large subunit ribosomal protein L13
LETGAHEVSGYRKPLIRGFPGAFGSSRLTTGAAARITRAFQVARKGAASSKAKNEPAMSTYSAKLSEIKKNWVLIDGDGLIVGRLASLVAMRLRGKHKPEFTPHMDCGDNVVIVNAGKVVLTGNKVNNKIFYYHTGYPGGIKERVVGKILYGKHPERVVEKAIERMLPKGPLGKKQLSNLYVYAGPEHRHAAQQPKPLDVKSLNVKNSRR